MIDEEFFRNRLTALREQKGVSEYQMSFDLGHSKSYIQSITSGRALPSMREFFNICSYLDITPKDFFDEGMDYPAIVEDIQRSLTRLQEDELKIVQPLVKRLEPPKGS